MPTSEERTSMGATLRASAEVERRHEAATGRPAGEATLACLGGDILDAFGDGMHVSTALDGLAGYIDPEGPGETCSTCAHTDSTYSHPWCDLWGRQTGGSDFCSHFDARE